MIRLSEYASSLYSTALDYAHLIDSKLIEYTNQLNFKVRCVSCAEEILQYISELKNLISESVKHNQITEEIQHVLQIMKAKEEQLMNFYTFESKTLFNGNPLSKWPLYVMLAGAVFCLGCSAVFHLFIAHSEKVNNLLNRLDYAGIAVLTLCSCYPPYFYLFHCDMSKLLFKLILEYAYIYLTFMTIMGLIVFTVSVREEFTKKEYHKIKGTLFLTFGISASFPVLHLHISAVNGYDFDYDFTYWFIGGFCYVFGAVIYILKFPERIKPGMFCIIGNSHQIFHFFVLGGVFTHYIGSVETYMYRIEKACPIV